MEKSGPVLDLDHLRRQTMGRDDLAREVLQLFLGQAETLLETVRTTTGRERSEAAHAIVGGARAIGAFPAADAARAVEHGREDMDGAVVALASALADARRAIGEFLEGPGRPPAQD